MAGVEIIGGGLAGAEAAWQVACRGENVLLYEMRPRESTPAHQTGFLAELVCSNSLGSEKESTGGGILKKELEKLGSLILETARQHRVPAGNALAVDRERFPAAVSQALEKHPRIEIVRQEVRELNPESVTVLATGPLTSPALTEKLKGLTGQESLFFFDAAAPLVYTDSINMDIAFFGSRYKKQGGDYINCPFTEEEYRVFYEELIRAEVVPRHDFEEKKLFSGCMPIENLARRGYQTLAFGPLKPVGLEDQQGRRPFAVAQLRRDNREGTLYNLVGFQTRLKWHEQKRVFRLIPGLEKAEFARLGVMHRNLYINSPQLLLKTLQLRSHPQVFFAGQITGVEGYLESAIMGAWAGINAWLQKQGREPLVPPRETASGSLIDYITASHKNFQPINMNFGLLPIPHKKIKNKEERRNFQVHVAQKFMDDFLKKNQLYKSFCPPDS